MVVNLDEHYMRLALALAVSAQGQTTPNPMVGAVLVKNGRIVGQGAHLYAGGPHAEIHALQMAGDEARGATAYVTLEPCSHYGRTPPCADALVTSGVGRVVVACEDKNPKVAGRGISRLRAAGIPVDVGLLREEAEALNEAFFCWAQHKRPLVVWKAAATLDGYTASVTGHSQYVTSEEARAKVQEQRYSIPAIAVGVGTVLADDPRLTTRLQGNLGRQPLRVIFDSSLRTPVTAKVLREPGHTVIYGTKGADEGRAVSLKQAEGASVEVVLLDADSEGRVCLTQALADLAMRGINAVLLEGGATLASQFLQKQFIDKVTYFIAPKLLGGGKPALCGLQPATMDEAIQLKNVKWQQVGSDLCVEGTVVYPDKSTF